MKKHLFTIVYIFIGAVVVFIFFSDSLKKKEDLNTVTVWHWMTDRHEAFEELARRYEQQAGIKVAFELFTPSDIYSKKITTSAQAKILPDIFGILDTKKTFSDFIQYGYVADLTMDYLKNDAQWQRSFFEEALNSNTFEEGNTYGIKPGIYGVPLDVTTMKMLYNKKLLEKAGYQSPPKTFTEFIEVAQALKRVGVPRMVSGWGEVWLVNCFAAQYAFNIMGEEKVMATYRGEVPYTDPDWIKVLNVFKIMADSNMLIEGVVAKPNKEAEQDFALERAAFAFNGSWSVNVYNEMNPDLSYAVFVPPAVNPQRSLQIWGWAGSSFMVNNRSSRKTDAIAFLKWLTAKEQQEYLVKETVNLPSNREALIATSAILEEFSLGMENATHPSTWELIEQPVVAERFGKGLQAILLGRKTPEQVAMEVQEVKVREMIREARRKE